MARVLLINSNRFRHPWPVLPFGLCYIATVLETRGNHQISLLDLCFSHNCEGDIRNRIRNFVPDVIGITIRNIDDAGGYDVHFLLEDVKKDVIDFCRNEFSGPIVLGGPAIGISGNEILEYFNLEYAVSGDGEFVMLEIVRRIESRQPLEGVEGLIIRRDNKIIQDSTPCRIKDLDSLPFPKPQQYLNLEDYSRFGSPLLVQTKRGCGFRCSYCTYNQIEGSQYRLRDPELVAEEIAMLVRETGIKNVEFADSIFNVPLSHCKEILKAMIRKNLKLRLHTMGLTPAAVDEELLDLMKLAGFNQVDIGAESVCDPILESFSKDFKTVDVINTANLLRRKKIPATWFIMLGAPPETNETVQRSLKLIGKVVSKWDLVFVSTGVRVYNMSPFAKDLTRQDLHCSHDNFFHPVKIEPKNLSLEEIREIAKRFSFTHPNFYFYEKEHMTPGWLLLTGNFILKLFHSRQPVWRLLIFLKKLEYVTGIGLIKRTLYDIKRGLPGNRSPEGKGFSLVSMDLKTAK